MNQFLYPVIHYKDMDTTLRNAEIAFKANCEGVFLIDHNGQDNPLDNAFTQIKDSFPDFLVGINRLISKPLEALKRDIDIGADATWVDNCWVTSSGASRESLELSYNLSAYESKNKSPNYKFFGSVAFKYQRIESDPAKAALYVWNSGFIPTTSGEATGTAPDISKIKTIAEALGNDKKLAIASGITVENVTQYLPYTKYFLVATGISKSFYEFDETKVKALANKIQTY